MSVTEFSLASVANPGSFTKGVTSSAKRGSPVNLLCIAWIDDTQLTRECFANAAAAMQPLLAIVPFTSARGFLADHSATADLVVYHQHGPDTTALESLADSQSAALWGNPLVILTDSVTEDVQRVLARFPDGMTTVLHTRQTSLQMVVASLFLIHHGREVAAPALSAPVSACPPPLPGSAPADAGSLTKRECSVLELVRQGYANKDIATDLQMSISTVKAHIRNIMQKRRATNRTQLALSAERQLRTPAGRRDD